MSVATDPTVSVVVVTKNEAGRIGDCLESVFDLCEGGPDFEVLLVDSNSDDETVPRAREYPVTILRIPSDDLASPAAGRYVGTAYADGEYILFVDGDMRLEPDWLGEALATLRSPGIVGVGGQLNDATERSGRRDVDALRGVAMYEAAALAEVGGFDPHLDASEDVDVGFRLVAAGNRLVELSRVVASHPDEQSVGEPLRRWRYGYFHGVGQAVRKGADDPAVLRRHVYTLRHTLGTVGWAVLGAYLLAGGLGRRAAFVWVAVTLLGVAVYVRKTSPRRFLVDGASYWLTAAGLILGGRRPRTDPATYPLESIEVVRAPPGA